MYKRNIVLLCAMALLQGMVFYAPVATLYRQAVGLSVFSITLIESVSLVLTMALEIPWGWVADRIGYRRTMLFCSGLFALSKVVFWQAAGFGGFLLERILLAVVVSGLSGVDSAMLYLSCAKDDARRVYGIYENLQQLGLLLAAGIFGLWLSEDYRLAAALTAAVYLIAAVLALGLKEVRCTADRNTAPKGGLRVLFDQLKKKQNLLLILSVALLNETHQTVAVFLNQLQYTRAGMHQSMISAAFIAVSLAGFAGGLTAKLSRRWGDKRLGSGLFLVAGFCCAVLAGSASAVVSVLAVLLLRAVFSLLQPMQLARQNEIIRTPDRATALSMNAAVMSSFGVMSNLCFGALADRSLPGAMLLGAGLCLTGLLLWRRSFRSS